MSYEYVEAPMQSAKIKVIGVGGGGGNALNCIAAAGIAGNVDYIAVNTDAQALAKSKATEKIAIGTKLTHGLGAGAKPEVGEAAAQESQDEISAAIEDADMVFITAGMGGGTGTGAAPVVAQIAQSMNKLTIAVVTKPFNFEGARKMQKAEAGISKLLESVDALIVIPNENLYKISDQKLTMRQSYALSDNVLKTDVISIAEIITRHDEINVDFADVTTIIKGAGFAHLAIGHGEGKDKVTDVVSQVISSPLLETSISGAKRLLINITMSEDIAVDEVDELTRMLTEAVDEDAEIIFGNGYNENATDEVYVTVIAADFDNAPARPQPAVQPQPIPQTKPSFQPQTSGYQPQTNNFQPQQSSGYQLQTNNFQPQQSSGYQPQTNNFQPQQSGYQPTTSNNNNGSNYQPQTNNFQPQNGGSSFQPQQPNNSRFGGEQNVPGQRNNNFSSGTKSTGDSMYNAGVKTPDNPDYYNSLYDIFKK